MGTAKDYINILKYLRKSKINSEIYAGKGNIKKQFEYANKRKLSNPRGEPFILFSFL